MKPKLEKGLIVLIVIFLVFFIADMISSLINPLIYYLEANPLVVKTGSFLPLAALNCFVLAALIYAYSKGGTLVRFMCTNYVVYIAFIRTMAIINNLRWYLAKPTIETVREVATPTAKAAISNAITIALWIPLIMAVIVFLLFKIDHNIKKKKDLSSISEH